MTPRLAPALILALALALCWTLAGHVARAGSAGRVMAASAANSPGNSESWDGSLTLPFAAGERWTYTGGPHMAWMPPSPSTALDFASNDGKGATRAVCPGTVTRADDGRLWLVCAGHGIEVLYLHQRDQVTVGTTVSAGDVIGWPACEGADLRCNGPHVHLAVMRDGAWTVPTLDGWTFTAAGGEYRGVATRGSERVCSIQVLATEQACTADWPTAGGDQ